MLINIKIVHYVIVIVIGIVIVVVVAILLISILILFLTYELMHLHLQLPPKANTLDLSCYILDPSSCSPILLLHPVRAICSSSCGAHEGSIRSSPVECRVCAVRRLSASQEQHGL